MALRLLPSNAFFAIYDKLLGIKMEFKLLQFLNASSQISNNLLFKCTSLNCLQPENILDIDNQ